MTMKPSWIIVFVAVLASLLEIIDTSIVNVAIPTMMGNLGATIDNISLVVTGYTVANAIVLPLAAWLGDRLGRRKYYLGCIGIFTAASLACGMAPNLESLIVFRVIQGLAGGALLPTSQTLIYEQFPKEKAGMAGAIFGMSVLIGPTLGPTLGGWLTDNLGWRSIFTINLPVGLLAIAIGQMVIKEPQGRTSDEENARRPIDGWGLLLLASSIGCLQYVLERGSSKDWFQDPFILTLSIVSIISFPLFIWRELSVKFPVIDLKLFKDSIVLNGVLLMGGLGFFLYGLIFVLPIFVNTTYHYTATQIGILFIPGSLATACVMPFVGRAMSKIDSKILIGCGLVGVLLCLSLFWTFSINTSEKNILDVLMVRGIAMGLLFVPINSSILSQFSGMRLGQISGLLSLFRQVGGSIGIAIVGTLLYDYNHENYQHLSQHVSLLDQPVQTLVLSGTGSYNELSSRVGMADSRLAAVKSIVTRVQAQSFIISFDRIMMVIFLVVLLLWIPLSRLKLRLRLHEVPPQN